MREKIGLHRQSLTVQMVLSFVGLVVLTAVVAGSLAIWVVRSQIERQAWAQLEQASRATTALYANWRSKVEDLATLTSQRPTLQTLLAHDEAAALTGLTNLEPAAPSVDCCCPHCASKSKNLSN